MHLDELRDGLHEVAARAPAGRAAARTDVLHRGKVLARRRRYSQASMLLVIVGVLIAGVFVVRGGQHDPATKTIVTTPSSVPPSTVQSVDANLLWSDANGLKLTDPETGRTTAVSDQGYHGYVSANPARIDGHVVFGVSAPGSGGPGGAAELAPGDAIRVVGRGTPFASADRKSLYLATSGAALEQTDPNGTVLGGPWSAPAGYELASQQSGGIAGRAVVGGVLVQTVENATDHTLAIWNPRTDALRTIGKIRWGVIDTYTAPGAATSLIATTKAGCNTPGCDILLIDSASGQKVDVPAPRGHFGYFAGGAFSPDGKHLAAFASTVAEPVDPAVDLTVIDIPSRTASVVRDAHLRVGEPIGLADWSPSGDWVFFSSFGDVSAYRTGSEHAVKLPFHIANGAFVAVPRNDPIPTPNDPGTAIEPLPSPGLSARSGEAVVWTGTNLVVWGGNLDAANSGEPGPDRVFNDGAFYSSATNDWTAMSPSPLPANIEQSVGVATDDGVVFARGSKTARWDPATNTWHELADAPRAVTDMTSTGSLVVSVSANATLDPASGEWRALPNIPAGSFDRQTITWTGNELVVIGRVGDFASVEGIALDPAQREWRRIPFAPLGAHSEALASAWDGRQVVVVNYDMRAVAYDPASNSWSTLPSVPARFFEWYPSMTTAGGYTMVFMAEAVVLRTPTGTWVPLPYGEIPFGTIATTHPAFGSEPADTAVYVYGTRKGRTVIVRVDPARLVAGASRLQVGTGSVRMPDGYRLRGSSYDLTLEEVDVQLAGPGDLAGANPAVCKVTSRYSGFPQGAAPSGWVQESLVNDGKATAWSRNAAGDSWRVGPTTSDGFTIDCTDPATARALAASASFEFKR